MKEKDTTKNQPEKNTDNKAAVEFPGYPAYPADEDIFNKFREEKEINPVDILEMKEWNEKPGADSINELNEELPGSDLDVPGSELDDELEKVGSEDEENNYYSIGGDNHNNLDENKSG